MADKEGWLVLISGMAIAAYTAALVCIADIRGLQQSRDAAAFHAQQADARQAALIRYIHRADSLRALGETT